MQLSFFDYINSLKGTPAPPPPPTRPPPPPPKPILSPVLAPRREASLSGVKDHVFTPSQQHQAPPLSALSVNPPISPAQDSRGPVPPAVRAGPHIPSVPVVMGGAVQPSPPSTPLPKLVELLGPPGHSPAKRPAQHAPPTTPLPALVKLLGSMNTGPARPPHRAATTTGGRGRGPSAPREALASRRSGPSHVGPVRRPPAPPKTAPVTPKPAGYLKELLKTVRSSSSQPGRHTPSRLTHQSLGLSAPRVPHKPTSSHQSIPVPRTHASNHHSLGHSVPRTHTSRHQSLGHSVPRTHTSRHQSLGHSVPRLPSTHTTSHRVSASAVLQTPARNTHSSPSFTPSRSVQPISFIPKEWNPSPPPQPHHGITHGARSRRPPQRPSHRASHAHSSPTPHVSSHPHKPSHSHHASSPPHPLSPMLSMPRFRQMVSQQARQLGDMAYYQQHGCVEPHQPLHFPCDTPISHAVCEHVGHAAAGPRAGNMAEMMHVFNPGLTKMMEKCLRPGMLHRMLGPGGKGMNPMMMMAMNGGGGAAESMPMMMMMMMNQQRGSGGDVHSPMTSSAGPSGAVISQAARIPHRAAQLNQAASHSSIPQVSTYGHCASFSPLRQHTGVRHSLLTYDFFFIFLFYGHC